MPALPPLLKFPRTPHLEGSRLQPGDEDMDQIPFAAVAGRRLVVTEKVDGANVGLSFASDGTPLLQSRGHYLTGGPRERHFALLKRWAASVAGVLHPRLGTHLLYGEWLFAQHTVFYDTLPHYFLAFDVFDRDSGGFLSRAAAERLLAGTPIVFVPIVARAAFGCLHEVRALLGASSFCSPEPERRRQHFAAACAAAGVSPSATAAHSDLSGEREGLVLREESEDGRLLRRLKFVRPSFSLAVDNAGTHWLNRPIVVNRLADPAIMDG